MCYCYGQTPADSIMKMLKKQPVTLKFLEDLHTVAYVHDSTEVYNIYQALLQKKPSPPVLFQIYYDLGKIYREKGVLVVALEYFLEARNTASKKNLRQQKAAALTELGWLYNDLQKSSQVLDYWLQAAEIYKELGNWSDFYEMEHLIANLYYRTGFYDDAARHFLRLTEVSQDSLKPRTRINIWNGLGLVRSSNEDYINAMGYFDTAMKIAEKQRDSTWIGILSGNLGKVYLGRGDTAIATHYFNKDLELSLKYQVWGSAINAQTTLAEIALIQQKYELAEKYLEEGLALRVQQSESHAHPIYRVLSDYYYAMEEYQLSRDYFKAYQQATDSLKVLRKENAINKMRNTVEFDKKILEINTLKRENEMVKSNSRLQNWIIWNNIALIAVIAVIGYLLHKSNQQKQKNNEQLQEQKAEIQALNENLEQIVSERTQQLQELVKDLSKQNQDLEQFSFILSHNIRASVAHILGLSSIFNRNDMADPYNREILGHLDKSSQNLDAVIKDLTKILTVRSKAHQEVELCILDEIYEEVVEKLKPDIDRLRAQITLSIEGSKYLRLVKAYVRNIFNELITNALKFHHPRRALQIKVSAINDGDTLQLIVEDNGLGFDEQYVSEHKVFGLYQRMHTHVVGKGLGLFILKTQIEALKGSIHFESIVLGGAKFIVTLPLEPALQK